MSARARNAPGAVPPTQAPGLSEAAGGPQNPPAAEAENLAAGIAYASLAGMLCGSLVAAIFMFVASSALEGARR